MPVFGFYDFLLALDKQILNPVFICARDRTVLTRADARCKDAFLPEQPLTKQLLRSWMNWRLGVQTALANYQNYVDTFDAKWAASPKLKYVVASANVPTDFSRVDRWYERDAGERAGAFMIYRVNSDHRLEG